VTRRRAGIAATLHAYAAGFTVSAKGGRVWLGLRRPDGDLTVQQAEALADALRAAARDARRMGRRTRP
jgi:hypothetical protein